MEELIEKVAPAVCNNDSALAVRDALDVLNGKWKLQILLAVYNGVVRFRKIAEQVPGITDRMLSKELKELEVNHLIERVVLPTFPPTVQYSITDHGRTLDKVIAELSAWGLIHRKKVAGR